MSWFDDLFSNKEILMKNCSDAKVNVVMAI